jgi:hypothetical protein
MRSRTSPVTDQQLKEAKRVKREGLEDVTVASAPAVGETSAASSPLSVVSPVSVPDEAEMTEEVAAADMAPEPVVSEDVDRIDPPPSELKLANGQVVLLKRMRTRQFFALLRIISRSAPTMMRSMSLDPSRQSMEEFTTNLIALLVVSIPEADTETLEFLLSMVEPRDLGVSDEQKKQAWRDLRVYLADPELDDTFNLVEAIIRREAPDLKALGERAIKTFQLAQKTGQVPREMTQGSSEASRVPST